MKFHPNVGIWLNSAALPVMLLIIQAILSASFPPLVFAGGENSRPPEKTEKTEKKNVPGTELKVKVFAATCLACVRRIERHLRQAPGVNDVTVKLAADSEVTITYDAKKISEKNILQLMEKEGYRVEKVAPAGKP